MRQSRTILTMALLGLLSACSSTNETPDEDRVNVEVHNTGTRTISVVVKSGSDESESVTLAAGELLADDYAGAVGTVVTVTATSAAGGGQPAATGSGTCTPKSPIVNTSNYGRINVAAGNSATITVTCVVPTHWNEGTQ